MTDSTRSWPPLYSGVALTALAMLLLELALTRIFSVVFYYHFAFLAISIAMFGLGAGGVFSYWIAPRRGPAFSRLAWLSLATSGLVLLALWALRLPDVDLALVYFTTALPFASAGAILSLAMSEGVARVDRVYFFDLAGAAAGCLLLVPLLNSLGGPGALLAVAVLFAFAAVAWFVTAGSRAGVAVAALASLGWGALLVCHHQYRLFDITYAKGDKLEWETYVRWNSFSRVAVKQDPGWNGAALIVIDADANTGICDEDVTRFGRKQRDYFIESDASGLAYVLRPGGKTLIIGPGGGMDVARALASGSRDITGVEINPLIATDIMRRRFAALSKRLYFRPEIRIAVEDGRAYVRRSREHYQILQATLVDTWASTAGGAFALTENNLYTVEAFTDYLQHLTDDGVMSFTRWGFDTPRESLRIVSLAIEALRRVGQQRPELNVAVIRKGTLQQLQGLGAQDTILISRRPLSADDTARVSTLASVRGYQTVYLPGRKIPGQFTDLLSASDRKAWIRGYRFDVSPVTDDRPFFFYTVQPRDLMGAFGAADFKINRAIPVLFGVLALSAVATLLVLALPPLVLGTRLPRRKGVTVFLLYFAAIGAGYILVEVALIQRFVLFLGNPTYALTVVIFALLLSSGLGSYFSRRIALTPALVAGAAAVLAFVLAPLLTACVGWPLVVKVLLTVVLLAPLGFLMGMPFPTGLRMLEAVHPPAVRWAWSLNAASSVLGSAAAIFFAIYTGLTATMLIGAALYLVATALKRKVPATA